jgi:hypothetical protein
VDEVRMACALGVKNVKNKNNVDTQAKEFVDANTRIDK